MMIGGRRQFGGLPGSSWFDRKNPRVLLNALYLQADPAFVRTDLTKTLAHELLGHVLETLKARRAGVESVL